MAKETRYVLITGCGEGGIGHALAKHFALKGFYVFATLLPHESRTHLEVQDIKVFNLDVTKEDQVITLSHKIGEITAGRLDILVNNAGICYTMPAVDSDINAVEKMFAINVLGPIRMVKFFHCMLVATKGIVINIGSVGGIVPYIYGATYNATKAALHNYGNTLRVELKPFGVRVMNVISGEVGTNILKNDTHRELPPGSIYMPLQEEFRSHVQRKPRTITPDEYAAGVVNEALKKAPVAWFWHGAQTFIVRWCDALLPRTFWDLLFWKMFKLGKLDSETATEAT